MQRPVRYHCCLRHRVSQLRDWQPLQLCRPQKHLVLPRFLDMCSCEPLHMALRLARWGGVLQSPKVGALFGYGAGTDELGWESVLLHVQEEGVRSNQKYVPSNVGNHRLFLCFPLQLCENILQFNLNIGFQLFICGMVNVGFQYSLITVCCISHLL